MRSLLIGNKRIKVITHQRLSCEDSWDANCFEFSEISKGELTLSRPINTKTFDNLDYVDLFFFISGKWKKFRLDNFDAMYEIAGQDYIKKLSFKIPDESFETSFRIARCC
jgi:hypothetical protein